MTLQGRISEVAGLRYGGLFADAAIDGFRYTIGRYSRQPSRFEEPEAMFHGPSGCHKEWADRAQ